VVTTPDVKSDGRWMSDPERQLVDAAQAGKVLALRPGSISGNDEMHHPGAGPLWAEDQTIRAEVLAALLTGALQGAGKPRAVMLRGARITGSLDLMGATLICPLWLSDCEIDQPVNLNEATAPSIRMPGCHLPSLTASQLRSTGDLVLDDKFTARDQIVLRGARIGGKVALSGAQLTALDADGLTAEQGMYCEKITATGKVSLRGAHIRGELTFRDASLKNPGRIALHADRLAVSGPLVCTALTAEGVVILDGAHIGSDVHLDRASLDAGHLLPALSANRIAVDDSMYCDKVIAVGSIHVNKARIGGLLSFSLARVRGHGSLCIQWAQIGSLNVILAPGTGDCAEDDVYLALLHTKVGELIDKPAGWPRRIGLHGFVYDRFLSRDPTSAASVDQRLDWVSRNLGGYNPQVYDQLAAAYRRAGQEEAARAVAIAKQRRRRSALNPAARLVNLIADVTVGYGYRTWKAGVWLVVLTALGTIAFSRIHMIASVSHPPAFNPLGYSLDQLLPIADLGQKNDWQPAGGYLYLAWLLRGIGWTLTTAVVAAVTGVLKRE
jgi:hypothetical protein